MRRILLIEDDRGMAHGLRYNLEAEGYDVVQVEDGETGLDRARSARFDLILLDLTLPGRGGFEVLRELRSSGDRTPIILMSARDAEEDRIEGLRLGADDFVGKPFGLGELLARIRARTRTARKVAVLDSAVNVVAGAMRAAGRNESLEHALGSLVDNALGLIGAERGLVILQDEQGSLHTRVARGRGGTSLPRESRFSTTIVRRVIDSGRTEAMLDAEDREQFLGDSNGGGSLVDLRLRQAVCTPLRSGESILGVLYADSRLSAQGFGREDLELIETLATQSGVLLERARLQGVQREQQRMAAELSEAKHLQQAMLPDAPVRSARLEIAGFNRPCEEAGGDYFDYIHLGDDRVAIVIGDVAGHGVGSALFMAAARSLLRTYLTLLGDAGLRRIDDVGSVLVEVNRALVRDMPPGSFMSLFLGDLNLSSGALRYASAGHAPGIVYRAARCISEGTSEGTYEELEPTGPALGVVDEAAYEVCTVVPPLSGEDAVLLYTDGATEAMGEGRELFGLERLKREFGRVHGERAPRIVDHLTEVITAYAGGHLDDDISFLVVKASESAVPAGVKLEA